MVGGSERTSSQKISEKLLEPACFVAVSDYCSGGLRLRGAGLIEESEVVRLGLVLPETVARVGRNRCLKLAGRGGRKREENLSF
ncbi:hypothetical protein L3X38_038393 [Prunus dulcis]|uniref:Uncharacterized protein n=1 Tax=Prunus dulcis TaxID=3755 RepID=A0AAD4YRH1_PRUDU|nr:hypothetical protein L3X38_038393 [Prunus dulcis]